jgi:hypothetical protein
MHLKLINTEQGTEITSLKDRVAAVEKELEVMTIQCKTFRCVIVDSDFYTIDTLIGSTQ